MSRSSGAQRRRVPVIASKGRVSQHGRMNLPRGLLAGTLAALVLTWGMFALNPGAWPGLVSPFAQSAVYLALVVITARSRRVKVLIVRTAQRWTLNPLMRLLLASASTRWGWRSRDPRPGVRSAAPYPGRQRPTGQHLLDHRRARGSCRVRPQHPSGPAGPGAATSWVEVPLGARNRRDRARRRRARPPTPHHPLAPPARAQRDQRASPRRRPAQRAGKAAA